MVVTSTDSSGAFAANLTLGKDYYLAVWFGNQQVYGRVVTSSSEPLLMALQSQGQQANQNSTSSQGKLSCQLTASRKPAVGQPLSINGRVVCGPSGDSYKPDTLLNQYKNRTDVPLSYLAVGWDNLKDLPSDQVNDFQGAPVMAEGYLSGSVKVQNIGSGESANCHLKGENEVDWHIYLTKTPNQAVGDAIICETTPRVRPAHKWTTASLSRFVRSNTRVRISGWLMYDFEHTTGIGVQRATPWEIHPITRIEIQVNGQWVDLDTE